MAIALRQIPRFTTRLLRFRYSGKNQGAMLKELVKEFESLNLQSEKGKFIPEPPKERTVRQQFELLLEVGKLLLLLALGKAMV
jgi:hypothetical protein